MKKLLIAILALGLTFGLTAKSEAVVLNTGDDNIAVTGATSPGAGDPILASIIGSAWATPSGLVSGTYSTWVRQDADGYLVFEYQITNSATSISSVNRATMVNFLGWTTDADSNSLSGTLQDATSMDRIDGATVGFDFSSGALASLIQPGETSEILWIKTNSKLYGSGFLSIIDGGSANVAAFQPAVPEPTSMMLFGTGLLGFVGRLRRKVSA